MLRRILKRKLLHHFLEVKTVLIHIYILILILSLNFSVINTTKVYRTVVTFSKYRDEYLLQIRLQWNHKLDSAFVNRVRKGLSQPVVDCKDPEGWMYTKIGVTFNEDRVFQLLDNWSTLLKSTVPAKMIVQVLERAAKGCDYLVQNGSSDSDLKNMFRSGLTGTTVEKTQIAEKFLKAYYVSITENPREIVFKAEINQLLNHMRLFAAIAFVNLNVVQNSLDTVQTFQANNFNNEKTQVDQTQVDQAQVDQTQQIIVQDSQQYYYDEEGSATQQFYVEAAVLEPPKKQRKKKM
jgi:hypothetical protein